MNLQGRDFIWRCLTAGSYQGDSVESARDNLHEALELFFETASAEEIEQRLRGEAIWA